MASNNLRFPPEAEGSLRGPGYVLTWLCIDRVEGTGPGQSPRPLMCHVGDSRLGTVPSYYKGQRSG